MRKSSYANMHSHANIIGLMRRIHIHVIIYESVVNQSGYFYISLNSTTTQRRYRHSTDTVYKFHAEAPQATASEGLTQGSYEEFEPMTLMTKGIESTNEPPRPYASIHNNANTYILQLLNIQLYTLTIA